jgi:hypothetical protein
LVSDGFLGGDGGLLLLSVGVAITTLPKRRPVTAADTAEGQAIKGLQSFEFKDAAIFAKLQRQRDVQECLEAIADQEFRFGLLLGESGCGKSSLLRAGLMPRMSGDAAQYQGVYVKLRDRAPVEEIRKTWGGLAEGARDDTLVALLNHAVQQAGKPLVLILDQFEQFFVQYKRPEERRDFIAALQGWYESDVP